jgi:DNA-directed RNA polymerase subunit RPC12/RpoP
LRPGAIFCYADDQEYQPGEETMRILGLISIGLVVFGLAAYYLMGESSPPFVVPLIIASGFAAVTFILSDMFIRFIQGQKKYQCLNCGKVVRGSNPEQLGYTCPNCGGTAFK